MFIKQPEGRITRDIGAAIIGKTIVGASFGPHHFSLRFGDETWLAIEAEYKDDDAFMNEASHVASIDMLAIGLITQERFDAASAEIKARHQAVKLAEARRIIAEAEAELLPEAKGESDA